jgi:hypothetical protein
LNAQQDGPIFFSIRQKDRRKEFYQKIGVYDPIGVAVLNKNSMIKEEKNNDYYLLII